MRILKKTLIAAGVLVAVAVVLAALGPMLVSRGLGQGFIRGKIEQRVNGSVSLGEVRLGWFGPQSLAGFEINGDDGVTAVEADVTVASGLFDLALGRVDALSVELTGSARGELRPDGSTSIDDLLRRPAAEQRPARTQGDGQPTRLPDLAGVPATTVALTGFTVTLAGQDPADTLVVSDLAGELQYTPGDRVKLDLAGGIGDGTVRINGHVDGLYDAGGAVTPAGASGRVAVELRDAPVPLTEVPTELTLLDLVATTDDPTDHVALTIEADAMVDGTRSGRLEGSITVDNPVDASGIVSFGLDRVSGRVTGRSMPTALLQRALRGTPIVATRDLGPVMDVNARFSPGTTREVSIAASTDGARLTFLGEVDDAQRVAADTCRIEAVLRPELVAQMTGVRIERPAPIVVELEELRRDDRIVARGTITLPQPVAVAEGQPGAALLRAVLDESLAVDLDAKYGDDGLWTKLVAVGDDIRAHGTATFDDGTLSLIELFASMEVTPALFTALQGPALVTMQLSPMALAKGGPMPPVTMQIGLPGAVLAGVPVLGRVGVQGDFAVTLAGETISVGADGLGLIVPKAALQERIGNEVAVVDDVPMKLDIRALRLPTAALAGTSFKGADADIDLRLEGGPVVIDDPRIGRNTVRNIVIAVAGDDLAAGVTTRLTGDVEFAGAGEPGALRLDGTVTDLMTDGRLTASQAALALSAKIDGLHTAVVDGLGDMQGLLVAALGPRINAVADADDFSRNSGTLATRIEASHGWLEGEAAGKDNALVVDAEKPVKAELELTPPLRQRLLYKIHPVLADIRTMEQPMRATIGASSIPLDGDVGRLDAKVEITVGKVEIDSGSRSLALLTLAQASEAGTLDGEIQPIRATITKGVVTYDEPMVIRIDKYTFIYTGSINLNRRYVDLVTEVPLEGLAGTFQELEGYTGDARIKMYYRGPFGDVQPQIDEERLAEVALEVGLRRGIGELEKEVGVPIGDIFDGIFGNKKKKKNE